MAVSIVQSQAVGNAASALTDVLTVAGTKYTTGNFVLAIVCAGNLTATGSMADSAGNTWTAVTGSPWTAAATIRLHAFTSLLTSDIPIAGTITYTSSSTTSIAFAAIEIGGSNNAIQVGTKVDAGSITSATVLDPPSVATTSTSDLVVAAAAAVGSSGIGVVSTGYANQTGASSATTIRTIDWMSKLTVATPTEDPDNAMRWAGSSTSVLLNTFSVGPASAGVTAGSALPMIGVGS